MLVAQRRQPGPLQVVDEFRRVWYLLARRTNALALGGLPVALPAISTAVAVSSQQSTLGAVDAALLLAVDAALSLGAL